MIAAELTAIPEPRKGYRGGWWVEGHKYGSKVRAEAARLALATQRVTMARAEAARRDRTHAAYAARGMFAATTRTLRPGDTYSIPAIDITEAAPLMRDCRNIGIVPDALDGRDLIVHVRGPVAHVSDYQTGEPIVKGRGWAGAMQALADHYGVPVRVSCDPGEGGGATTFMVGRWIPCQRA